MRGTEVQAFAAVHHHSLSASTVSVIKAARVGVKKQTCILSGVGGLGGGGVKGYWMSGGNKASLHRGPRPGQQSNTASAHKGPHTFSACR